MDNDVRNTEYCIGFSTAISRATEAIERQRTTVGSHERIGIFRIFGRDAGYTALYTAYVSSMRCCIPEYKFDLNKLFELLMADKRNNPSNYALVVLSEGADWQNHEMQEKARPTPSAIARRPTSARNWPTRSRRRWARRPSSAISPTTCAAAARTSSTRWSPTPSPAWRSIASRTASPA